MEDFKSIFNLLAALIGIVVFFFFKGNPNFVYTASGILWGSVVIEFLFRKKLPKSTITIRSPWLPKAFTAVIIIDIGTRIFEPGDIIVYNPSFLLALPFMVLNVLDRSERIYLYDEGMVFDGNTACEG